MGSRTHIHPLAAVKANSIGEGTRIWQFVVILPDAQIGADCNICSHCFIENDVRIGDRVTIKNGVQLWNGTRIDDDVFIGPNVTFTNLTRQQTPWIERLNHRFWTDWRSNWPVSLCL